MSNSTRTKRQLLLAALLGAALLVAGGYAAYQSLQPKPPAVDLTGADPAVVEAIEAAAAAVRAAPRSGNVWGRLGMLLATYKFNAEALVCFARAEALDPTEPRWPYLYGVAAFDENPDEGL